MSEPVYEWDVTVRRWNHYGSQIVEKTPLLVQASTRKQVTVKVRAAFGAKYDDFRGFWSHDWTLNGVREVPRSLGREPGGRPDWVESA